jgi:hypothetical protein
MHRFNTDEQCLSQLFSVFQDNREHDQKHQKCRNLVHHPVLPAGSGVLAVNKFDPARRKPEMTPGHNQARYGFDPWPAFGPDNNPGRLNQ